MSQTPTTLPKIEPEPWMIRVAEQLADLALLAGACRADAAGFADLIAYAHERNRLGAELADVNSELAAVRARLNEL